MEGIIHSGGNVFDPATATMGLIPARVYVPSTTPITVRFSDVDMMQVAHHGAYVHWFEQIRFGCLDRLAGISFADLLAHGVALPVIEMSIAYKRSFRFSDRPVGFARVQLFPQAKLTVHYAIHDAVGGWLGASGSTTHCYTDRDGKLLLRTPGFIAKALQHAQQAHPDGFFLGTATA
jgi:acyl-CoA thioester hydrolase